MTSRRRHDQNLYQQPGAGAYALHESRDKSDRRSRRPPAIDTSLSSPASTRDTISERAAALAPLQPLGANSHHYHSVDGSFLDNPTPVDAEMSDAHGQRAVPQRDSHDLSYSTRDVTRDSLVANMLLSLDQFSSPGGGFGPDDAYDDAPQIFNSSRGGSHPRQASRHQHSHSSDLETADDASRISSQTTRGRRSNSSSNFHNTHTRLNSVREAGAHASQKQQASGTTRARHTHTRGSGKESRNSSLTSVDAGHGHLKHRQVGRSSSLDHTDSQLGSVPSSPFRVEFDGYDAAPTPTIPSGPRRYPSTPVLQTKPPLAPPTEPRQKDFHSTLLPDDRKRSLSSRSVKNTSSRRGTFAAAGAATRDAAANASLPPPPALPAAAAMSAPDLDSAPAPSVGYGKSKEAARDGSQNATSTGPVPKEKQGFFRRVFGYGSSKTSESPAMATTPSHKASAVDRNLETRDPASTPPSRDTSSSHSNHPALQKKPSSFFRRRKKSAADQPPPLPSDVPPVPPATQSAVDSEKTKVTEQHQSSRPSSLREAMTPFLDNNRPHGGARRVPHGDVTVTPKKRGEDLQDADEYKRDFSPDYEPSPNARIRAVPSATDDLDHSVQQTPTRAGPAHVSRASQSRSSSFLNLDGGSDGESSGTGRDRNRSAKVKAAPKSAKDDTLRASYKQSRHHTQYHTDSEAEAPSSKLALPRDNTRGISPASDVSRTDSRSEVSTTPSVLIESPQPESTLRAKTKGLAKLNTMQGEPLDEPDFVIGEPTEDERQKAQQIFDGNENFIQKSKAAGWMGELGPIRQRTLAAYMDLFDFASVNIVSSLRQVCERLVLRAETQQIDRILVAFAKRWCVCNPKHGFKTRDVIHTICYSIMLLNTDLHMAEIESKMTRSQFVKNTMTTISESVPETLRRQTILPAKSGAFNPEPTTTEPAPKSLRHSFLPPPRTETQGSTASDSGNDCGPLVKKPYEGTFRGWEEQVEQVLKDTYASIRDERLPLHGAEAEPAPTPSSANNLSVMGMLKRTPSVLSKAPSEGTMSTQRGRVPEAGRNNAGRWTSKSRSRPGVSRNGFASSHTSFDDQSMWSPALSSATWSKYSLGRTQGTASQDSFAVSMGPRGDYHQSIGFANALSQAITRDDTDGAGSVFSDDLPDQLLEDESLELMGPPWIKEGMVIHKHHLDSVGKKAKERSWNEVFAVIQKGQMSLFSFTASKSQRQKTRGGLKPVVGGGNWQDNAANMGTFNLRQCLASALPSPGYSRSRPHVWALSLPTGAVHLFQVGTPEIIKEFVMTANYWSARLSVHPLVGGISNIEYGWSEQIVNNSLVMAINQGNGKDVPRPPSSAQVGRRSSIASARTSIRSASIDLGQRAFTHDSGRGKLPGDRLHIANWMPPTQSMRASTAREEEQLATLAAYVQGIEEDLQAHNQLRSPMLLAFTPRGANAGKAMHNWEAKSAYLLREIVKYRTYTDCLQQAGVRRAEVDRERELARRAARGELSERDMQVSDDDDDDESAGDVTMKA